MKLAKIEWTYRADGWGAAGYDPAMMVALLLYAYCLGERSSRRIEQRCERDVAFRVLTANQGPDHTMIARVRQTHEQAWEALFTQVLKLCADAGLVKVGVVALDGTTVEAHASLAANRTVETIKQAVTTMVAEAHTIDDAEDRVYGPDRRGDELPEALRDRTRRLTRLQECQERLQREATEAVAQQQAKIEVRQAEETATGQKTRGRKPKAPEAAADATAKANVTDPESRIMKTQRGSVHGDHAQAMVTEEQSIVAAEVTQEANDIKQLHPIEHLQPIGTVLADAGSCSEATLTDAEPAGPELVIATNKDWKQRQALREQPCPRGRIPKRLSRRDWMERKRLTTRGRRFYKKRGQTVEPVFGQSTSARGCDRCMRRGKEACASEWTVLCATHNLLKLWRSGKAAWASRRGCRGPLRVGRGSREQTGERTARRPWSLAAPPTRGPRVSKQERLGAT